MLSVNLLLIAGAFVITLLHAVGKAPIWPALLLVIVALLLIVGVR